MVDVINIRPRFRRRGLLYKRCDSGTLVLFERPGRHPVCVLDNGDKSGFRPASSFHESSNPVYNIITAEMSRGHNKIDTIVKWLHQRSCQRPKLVYK